MNFSSHETMNRLTKAAITGRDKATPKLSGFKVGAAILGEDDIIYVGANHETTCGALIHAEQGAVAAALNAGVRTLKAAAVVADSTAIIRPCGGCLQWLSAFMPRDGHVYCKNIRHDEISSWMLKDLLPICPDISQEEVDSK